MSKKKAKKRDMQAGAKVLSYFLTTREGKPTTIKQASKALKVPAQRLQNHLNKFTKESRLQRLDRGLYQAAPKKEVKKLSLPEFLAELKKERATLDQHIERVEHVIELKKQRGQL
jgi:hypothetical protein